jgi:hypothetical protein
VSVARPASIAILRTLHPRPTPARVLDGSRESASPAHQELVVPRVLEHHENRFSVAMTNDAARAARIAATGTAMAYGILTSGSPSITRCEQTVCSVCAAEPDWT